MCRYWSWQALGFTLGTEAVRTKVTTIEFQRDRREAVFLFCIDCRMSTSDPKRTLKCYRAKAHSDTCPKFSGLWDAFAARYSAKIELGAEAIMERSP